jgi:alpha,alpha-trehalase
MEAHEYPIKDYAIIGNCETAALINSAGGIDWLCLPAFDAPSFFGALLDREKGGEFFIRPADDYRAHRRYIDDTAILETRFVTNRGTLVLTDFFVIARQPSARFYDFTSLHPARKLVRLLRLEEGDEVSIQLKLAARPDYGRRRPQWRRVRGGFECEETSFFSDMPVEENAGEIVGRLKLKPGPGFFTVLDYSGDRRAPNLENVHRWREVTRAFWIEWNLFNYYRGPHQAMVKRSAVTLKLLTYARTGAIVAAPTLSLPEKLGGEANWDYRFTWMRDTALLINTLFRLGYSGEAKAFFQFIADKHCEQTGDGPAELPVLLPIRNETRTEEEILDHLAGYRGSRPVRRGNHATTDLQLDNYGYLLQSLVYWKHTGGKLDERKRRMACDALAVLRRRWREPDNGIWEGPERKQHTHSKVSAWLAFERARDLGLVDDSEAARICREIFQETIERGVRERNGRRYLADHFDSGNIDCSALLAFTSGFLPEPLARSTREEIEERLAAGPWLYRSDWHRESGEGAFVLCSFWWVGQLIREGDLSQAEKLLEDLIAAASPLGLYSEEIDPGTGEFLGNFPQAFSHLGLIAAILDLEDAKKNPRFAAAPDHEKFQKSIGATIRLKGIIAGFFRVPKTIRLLFSGNSKWNERLHGGNRE